MIQSIYVVDAKGQMRSVGLHDEKVVSPEHPKLYPAFPNPFNPSTTIRYDVSEPAQVVMKVYSITGQEARTLVHEPKVPGMYEVIWDGKDQQGRQMASGLYFYRISIGHFHAVQKAVLLK